MSPQILQFVQHYGWIQNEEIKGKQIIKLKIKHPRKSIIRKKKSKQQNKGDDYTFFIVISQTKLEFSLTLLENMNSFIPSQKSYKTIKN